MAMGPDNICVWLYLCAAHSLFPWYFKIFGNSKGETLKQTLALISEIFDMLVLP